MYDNGVGVLSQYGLTAITTCKGRGAMLCETETGWKSIQEFGGARNKLELQCQLQEQLMRSGAVQTDCPLRNETGELVSQGEDGLFYVVREWHPGKECDTRSIPEIRRAASAMARLHKAACLPLQKEYEKESLISECVRHNAEIRKIKKYISKKQKKNTFEKLLLGSADEFLEQGDRQGMLLLFDLDNFKRVNDGEGHPAGDRLLIRFARCLCRVFRREDVIGRLGGDEFVVFLQGAITRELLDQRMERFSAALSAYPKTPISCSAGILFVQSEGFSYTRAILLSDKALYSSKQKGKKQHTYADPNETGAREA